MNRPCYAFLFSFTLFAAMTANAYDTPPSDPTSCGSMEYFDYGIGMCSPLAMKEMPMKMIMVHGNIFGGQTIESGPRGRSAAWSTSMMMADAGTSVGDNQYLNINLMATAEK